MTTYAEYYEACRTLAKLATQLPNCAEEYFELFCLVRAFEEEDASDNIPW